MPRKSWLMAAAAWAVCAGSALAGPLGPACPLVATLDVYVTMGATGCSVGPLNFRDFGFWPVSSSPGYSPIGPTAITVTPVLSPSGPSLTFISSGFWVGSFQSVNYVLTYNIDPPPVIIRGFDEEMYTETPSAPGLASITTSLCVGGYYHPVIHVPIGCGSTLDLTVYHDGGPSPVLMASASWAPPVSLLGVWHDIMLDATTGGSADFATLTNDALVIPEPAGWLLGGFGLLALALLRWRRTA